MSDLNPARLIRRAKPAWAMLGLEWEGPGVVLLASRTITAAELDFRARQYDFRDWADFMSNFRPELTLSVHMFEDYVLVFGATYAECLAQLLQIWDPDDRTASGPRGIESASLLAVKP